MAIISSTLPITLLMRVGDSDVLNELGVIDMTVDIVPITDENRQPGDAVEAEGRVEGFDLASALRQFADAIDAGTVESPSEG